MIWKIPQSTFYVGSLVFLLVLAFTSCIPGKVQNTETCIEIEMNENDYSFINQGDNLKGYSMSTIQSSFDTELKSTLAYHNITPCQDARFRLEIDNFAIKDYKTTEQVHDVNSPSHNEVFDINTVNFSVTFRLFDGTELIDEWVERQEEEDELTSNRSFGQMIFGDNKEGDVYRVKYKHPLKAVNVCARISGRTISRKIFRYQKNQ